jgi:hypothetical protein
MHDNSYIFYKGNSRITGRPIVGILTGISAASRNAKTGEMYQTYIFADNGRHPFDNVRSGADRDICGECPRRPFLIESGVSDLSTPCYLKKEMGRAIHAVWARYAAGKTKAIRTKELDHLLRYFGRSLRISAYGDPTSIPVKVWRRLIAASKAHTGYTQFWNQPKNRTYKDFLQASVHTKESQADAADLGWATFRADDHITDQDLATSTGRRSHLATGEIPCPHPLTKGRDRPPITCATCLKCNGSKSVAIAAH